MNAGTNQEVNLDQNMINPSDDSINNLTAHADSKGSDNATAKLEVVSKLKKNLGKQNFKVLEENKPEDVAKQSSEIGDLKKVMYVQHNYIDFSEIEVFEDGELEEVFGCRIAEVPR